MARPSDDAPPDVEAQPGDALRRGYARGRERDERIRASLEPLDRGERPGAVTVAALVTAVLGLVNVGLYASGVEVDGAQAGAAEVAVFAGLAFGLAIAMWRASYWAVLVFQALLAATVVIAGLSVMVASDLAALALCLTVAGLGGWLFWKLVRALARLQMAQGAGPAPPAPGGDE